MKQFCTAESVTEGHPYKLCDLIADSILDECLKYDPEVRVACEVLATRGNLLAAGEITSSHEPYVFEIMKKVLVDVGYGTKNIQMDALIYQQSPGTALKCMAMAFPDFPWGLWQPGEPSNIAWTISTILFRPVEICIFWRRAALTAGNMRWNISTMDCAGSGSRKKAV